MSKNQINGQLCDPNFKIKHGQNIYEVWDDTRPSGKRVVVEIYNDEDINPSITQQNFKDDCDVNLIMEKYAKIGMSYGNLPEAVGSYADLSNIPDYMEMQKTVIAADQAFDALPHKLKTRFNQSPAELIKFLADESNMEESYKLGLRVKPEAPKPDPLLTEMQGLRQDLKPKKKAPAEE